MNSTGPKIQVDYAGPVRSRLSSGLGRAGPGRFSQIFLQVPFFETTLCLPETLTKPFLIPSKVNVSIEKEPEISVEVSSQKQKTKCQHNPEKVYVESRSDIPADLIPVFTCSFKNGKCTVECPAGSKRKLKAVKCQQMNWKPLPQAWKHKEYCTEGIFNTLSLIDLYLNLKW